MTLHSRLAPTRLCIIDGEPCLWTGTGWHALADLRDRLDRLRDQIADIRRRDLGAQIGAQTTLQKIDIDHIRHLLNEAQTMTPRTMHDPLATFLHRISHLYPDELHDAFVNEVNEIGGTWIVPEGTTSHLVEINLHGITGRGTSESEAICDWRGAAESTLTKET